MTKTDIIDSVSKATGFTKAQTQETIDSFINTIKENVEQGVRIAGFGVFSVSDRKARMGRNPQTGAEIEIKASKSPVFKAGKEFKSSVNPVAQ